MSPPRRRVLATIVSAVSVCLCIAAAAPVPHTLRPLDTPGNISSGRGIPTAQLSIAREAGPFARNTNQIHRHHRFPRSKGIRSAGTGTSRAHLHHDCAGVCNNWVVLWCMSAHVCGQLLPSLRRPLRRSRDCIRSCSLRPPYSDVGCVFIILHTR